MLVEKAKGGQKVVDCSSGRAAQPLATASSKSCVCFSFGKEDHVEKDAEERDRCCDMERDIDSNEGSWKHLHQLMIHIAESPSRSSRG